ncbi:MAG: hypothetical protein ACOYED_06015 [Peptococcia bacterium]|jgi:7,8-dihydro-6-hydroxymethylpterin-pyrophosphokinase
MLNGIYEANRVIRRDLAINIIKNSSSEFLNLLIEDNGVYKLSKMFNVYKEAENNLIRVFEEYKNGDRFIRDSKEWQMFRNELYLRYDAAREAVAIMEKSEITRNDVIAYLKICQSLGGNINKNQSELLQTLKAINLTERGLDSLIHEVNEAEKLSVTEWLDKMGTKDLNSLNKNDYEDMLSEAWKLRKDSFNQMFDNKQEKINVAEFSNPHKDWITNSVRDEVMFEAALRDNVNKDDLMARIFKGDSRELLEMNELLNLEDVCYKDLDLEKISNNKIKNIKQKNTKNRDWDDKRGR